jgi:hypothetical protein
VVASLGTLAFASIASADETFQKGERLQKPSQERMEEMKVIMESGDYDLWYTFASEHDHPKAEKMLEVINEDNFYLLVELHEARMDKDRETAHSIMDELGIERPERPEKGMRGMHDHNEEAPSE